VSQLTRPQFVRYRERLISRKLLTTFDNEPAQHYEVTLGELYLQLIAEIEYDLRPTSETNTVSGGITSESLISPARFSHSCYQAGFRMGLSA
jgi:hypothetical protein